MEEMGGHDIVKVAGVCGQTPQAVAEAELAAGLGYNCVLASLAAFRDGTEEEMLTHIRALAAVAPVFGFYLQPAVGGCVLPYRFWRRFCDIENVVAIKIAPFNRYQTLDVIRALAASGRAGDITLYTGNDDNIALDLLSWFHFEGNRLRIRGGLLGHWAVWTRRAVEQLDRIHKETDDSESISNAWLTRAAEITDANAALFDVANQFRGCIAGIHEVLRRQGLMEGRWCLDPDEDLSDGQAGEITRVSAAYPHLNDDDFVRERLDEWLR
jgi:dihydrodipicolinate synthase/N-acetylneuraminate lyase